MSALFTSRRSGHSLVCAVSVALALVLASLSATAQTEQMAFYGAANPEGSISAEGVANSVVYLRWEVVEGYVPADLIGFNLYRDGTLLNGTMLDAVFAMSPSMIDALYSPTSQVRRKAEIIRWLNEGDATTVIDASNFAGVIHQKLKDDEFWARAASQVDPNIAISRNRGFVDVGATGVHTYQLEGVFLAGVTKPLGSIVLDGTAPYIAPTALDFRALEPFEMARCDAPERGRAHSTVALTWDYDASTPTARFGLQNSIAGYDIWRTTTSVSTVPTLSLRTAAGGVSANADGTVSLGGLEKVNDQPVTMTGLPDSALGYDGWAPEFYHFLETAEELASAGLQPGDTRAYFLVARDFTGNYGDTVGALVTIPDLSVPPAPWGIHSRARPAAVWGSDSTVVRWPETSIANFIGDRSDGRTYCNLDSAQHTGKLRFATTDTCATATVEYNFDVDSYRIYRFASEREAMLFADSDGDGSSDAHERAGDPTDPTLSCDPTAQPSPAQSKLVATLPVSTAVSTLANGRRVASFTDTTPGTTKGKVYWYRVAAVATNGEASELSAPVRAMFPDYEVPARDEAGEICVGTLAYAASFDDIITLVAIDETGDASWVRLGCDPPDVDAHWETLELLDAGPIGSGAILSSGACDSLQSICGQVGVTVEYYDEDGRLLDSVTTMGWNTECADLSTRLQKSDDKLDKIQDGEETGDDVYIDVSDFVEGEHCVGLYREIGGESFRVELICEDVFPLLLDFEHLGQTNICLTAVVQDTNNNLSASTRLPCFTLEEQAPQPPQPLGWTFDPSATSASFSWNPARQPALGAIVEWYRADGSDRSTSFVPHDDGSASAVGFEVAVDLGGPLTGDEQEEWCFRARSVVIRSGLPDETVSDWSTELCSIRAAAGEVDPEYLPWPSIPQPPRLDDRQALYLKADGLPIIDFGVVEFDACAHQQNGCAPPYLEQCLDNEIEFDDTCFDPCDDIDEAVAGQLDFAVYRQARLGAAVTPTEYVQVSPVIDRLHCRDPDAQGFMHWDVLSDPFFSLVEMSPSAPWEKGKHIVYVDRFPHEDGLQYRYQIVWFDSRGSIASWAESNWIQAEEP